MGVRCRRRLPFACPQLKWLAGCVSLSHSPGWCKGFSLDQLYPFQVNTRKMRNWFFFLTKQYFRNLGYKNGIWPRVIKLAITVMIRSCNYAVFCMSQPNVMSLSDLFRERMLCPLYDDVASSCGCFVEWEGAGALQDPSCSANLLAWESSDVGI